MKTPPVVALTGSTGFVGATLLPKLTVAGWRVRALYRPRPGRVVPALPGVEWVPGDIEDESALNALVAGAHAVIHCAGVVRGVNRADFDRVNEHGTRRVALAVAHQAEVPRLLLISSLAARKPELSHYAGSKWRGECALKAVAENLCWTVLRPPAVFGPGDREMRPLFQAMARGYAPVPMGGQRYFSLIYVEDLAAAVVKWLHAGKGYGQTFELDDGRPGGYDWDTVLEIAGRVLRDGMPVRRIPIPVSMLNFAASMNALTAKLVGYAPLLTPGKVREITHQNWVCDNESFCREFAWQPKIGLEHGLKIVFGKN